MQPYRFLFFFIIFISFRNITFAQADNNTPQSLKSQKKLLINAFVAFSIDTMLAETKEYVLQSGFTLSELRWPLTPSLSYTISCGLYFPKGIHIGGNITLMQRMPTGTMVDKDFEDVNKHPPRFGLTNFSEHNCSIINGIRGTVKIGMQLPIPQTAALKKASISLLVEPMLSLHYSAISWYAYDGYLQYAKENKSGYHEPWSADIPKSPVFGSVISYSQQLIIPAIGFGLEASFPYRLHLSSDLHATADVIASGEDLHYFRNIRFVDMMTGGWAVYGDIRFTWQCLPHFALFFNLFYEHCITMEGATLTYSGINSSNPSAYAPPGASGTALRGCTFSSGFAFTLGR